MNQIDPRDFGRLEGKVDAILARLTKESDEQEKRIKALEVWRSALVGAWTVVMGLFAIIFGSK